MRFLALLFVLFAVLLAIVSAFPSGHDSTNNDSIQGLEEIEECYITLHSADHEETKLNQNLIEKSGLLKILTDNDKDEKNFNLQLSNYQIKQAVNFMEKGEINWPKETTKALELFHAANYLDIPPMLHSAMSSLCSIIRIQLKEMNTENELLQYWNILRPLGDIDRKYLSELLFCVVRGKLPLANDDYYQAAIGEKDPIHQFKRLLYSNVLHNICENCIPGHSKGSYRYNPLSYEFTLENPDEACLSLLFSDQFSLHVPIRVQFKKKTPFDSFVSLLNSGNAIHFPELHIHVDKVELGWTSDPISNLKTIGKLSNLPILETLWISNTKITDAVELFKSDIPLLKQLSIDTCWPSRGIQTVGKIEKMPNLRELILRQNRITNTTDLFQSNLPLLEKIDLYGNEISTTGTISNMRKLKYLNLGHNNMEDSTDLFKSILPSLETLELQNNFICTTGRILNMKKLTMLDMRSNSIKDTTELFKSYLPELKWFYLTNNEISKTGRFMNMGNLVELDLVSNKIADKSELAKSKIPPNANIYLDDNPTSFKEKIKKFLVKN